MASGTDYPPVHYDPRNTVSDGTIPVALQELEPYLRAVDEIKRESPRVAYLCLFFCCKKADEIDSTSRGRGVRQFKTSLRQRVHRERLSSEAARKAPTDVQEVQSYYTTFVNEYRNQLKQAQGDNRAEANLRHMYETAQVLYDVLTQLHRSKSGVLSMPQDVEQSGTFMAQHPQRITSEKSNILSPATDQLNEVRVAREWLTRAGTGLGDRKEDGMDWLQRMYGFQKDNVLNQREHLVLLLANCAVRTKRERQDSTAEEIKDKAIQNIFKRLTKNYRNWCKFLNLSGRRRDVKSSSSIDVSDKTPTNEKHQRRLLYTSLYLLIWGEAANVRHLPEGLCYIFHHMAYELNQMLSRDLDPSTNRPIRPRCGPEGGRDGRQDEEAFLRNVIQPLYDVLASEAKINDKGNAPHGSWRNYDDFNEYFWDRRCFDLGWKMDTSMNFFETIKSGGKRSSQSLVKVNHVERRSFWHVFRSFDRLWTFLILSLQVLIVMAFADKWYYPFTKVQNFEALCSVFVTMAGLRLLQATLDVFFNYGLYKSLVKTTTLRIIAKFVTALVWFLLLFVLFIQTDVGSISLLASLEKSKGLTYTSSSIFLLACAVYLIPTAMKAALFIFPLVRRQLEMSNSNFVRLILWWSQTSLYVGRGMHESQLDLTKYTVFWLIMLTCKLLFSYSLEIKPLVVPTRIISRGNITYVWHEFVPNSNIKIGITFFLWAPVVLVYMMDLAIWYAVFQTLVGGLSGAFQHLGEVRSLSMIRDRFRSIPEAFGRNLLPNPNIIIEGPPAKRSRICCCWPWGQKAQHHRLSDGPDDGELLLRDGEGHRKSSTGPTPLGQRITSSVAFAQLWNEVIKTLREEDLLSNEERALLLVPYTDARIGMTQWPPFLLVSKIQLALQAVSKNARLNDGELWKQLSVDEYTACAVRECVAMLEKTLENVLPSSSNEAAFVKLVFQRIASARGDVVKTFGLSDTKGAKWEQFRKQLIDLTKLLIAEPDKKDDVRKKAALQTMYEVITRDILDPADFAAILQPIQGRLRQSGAQLFDENLSLNEVPKSYLEQLRRFHLLLSTDKPATDVPTNLEARRRLQFFINSLFMYMPRAPPVADMISFSILTPYYSETVLYDLDDLTNENDDGITTLFYLQKVFPDEWRNFLQRCSLTSEYDAMEKGGGRELCWWASFRGQTLARTVRGMMYNRHALLLQGFLEHANDAERAAGFEASMAPSRTAVRNSTSLWNHLNAIADIKFMYVVSAQVYTKQKQEKDPKKKKPALDVLELMKKYPRGLRIACIEEKDADPEKGIKTKQHYSVLLKIGADGVTEERVYEIKLPGAAKLGEGKPENQNHAIIFTRGEALQAIDMNQDMYLEEAFKMRNLLEEFYEPHGIRQPTILGVREHIFTGSVSSLAWFMSNQEMSFVTIGQRVLADPLKVRFHYGHPDVFDRLFHLTRGGISKASRALCISEDIYAGFNSTLRKGNVTHHEYLQVGKGRDVGVNQVSMFEAKVSGGNGEQILSRDVYRLGHRFDFFRMLSMWYTTIGFYFCQLVVLWTLYIYLYGKLYFSLSGVEESLDPAALTNNTALEAGMSSLFSILFGVLLGLPMLMEIGLEHGFHQAAFDFILMNLQMSAVFFTFSLGTKAHFFGRSLLHGGAKYRATGRGFVVEHVKFAEIYRLFSRSHFNKGLEIALILVVWRLYGTDHMVGHNAYILATFTLWFLVVGFLFAPFFFNPSGFEWIKTVDDLQDWLKWMRTGGGIGVKADVSWSMWWEEELDHLKYTGWVGRTIEVLLSLRWFIFQYGIVYQLSVVRGEARNKRNKHSYVYFLSWAVLGLIAVVYHVMRSGNGRSRTPGGRLTLRLVKAAVFIGATLALSLVIAYSALTIHDCFACVIALGATGWGLVQLAQAFYGVSDGKATWFAKKWWQKGSTQIYSMVRIAAHGYDYAFGILIFAPIAILSWLPFVSTFQTRLLFNQAFSRGLQISRILAGDQKRKHEKEKEKKEKAQKEKEQKVEGAKPKNT